MNPITADFFAKTKIAPTAGAVAIMDFLSEAESVDRMILMAELKLPSLTGVVQELEARFENDPDMPLNKQGAASNATNRQNVGRMIKFIMHRFGYTPAATGLSERTRLREFANSKCFTTGAVYERTLIRPVNHLEKRITGADDEPEEA